MMQGSIALRINMIHCVYTACPIACVSEFLFVFLFVGVVAGSNDLQFVGF